uniref:Uncharacterized protein n=1 Tax=Anguilla anguilla TaxID=7936 RepID=A0A0E9TBG1_ANGAN
MSNTQAKWSAHVMLISANVFLKLTGHILVCL